MIKVVLQVSCIATLTEIKIMIFLMRKQKEDLIKLFVTATQKDMAFNSSMMRCRCPHDIQSHMYIKMHAKLYMIWPWPQALLPGTAKPRNPRPSRSRGLSLRLRRPSLLQFLQRRKPRLTRRRRRKMMKPLHLLQREEQKRRRNPKWSRPRGPAIRLQHIECKAGCSQTIICWYH